MESCIFCQIVAGKIPSKKVYEDEEIVIFEDVAPKAKIHLLCVPKEHFATLAEADDKRAALLGRALKKIGELKEALRLTDGYRLIVNQGENAGQTVHHLHIHILGGEILPW